MEQVSPEVVSPTGCPVSALGQSFDPFTDRFQADPYAIFEEARRDEPVLYSPGTGAFVVTRYDDVAAVMKDPETFSASNVVDFVVPPCAAAMEKLMAARFVPGPVTVNEDDPEHRPHRDVLRRAFSKERLAELEPMIRGWVADYVDKFVKKGEADLVLDYMWEIPALAAFYLIGVPDSEVARVKQFAVQRAELNFGRPSEERQVQLAEEFGEFWEWCMWHVDTLWENPNSSFMSEMIELAKEPEYSEILDRTYIYRMCMNLLFAGHETTTNGAGNAFVGLLTNIDQWQRLVDDPSLTKNAADETLRYLSAAPMWRRRATRDTEIGGVKIPAESQVLVAFGSANRDEAHFPNADQLDVSREDARQHFTFGWGRHKCLGQGLARMEISIAIEELTRRLPHMRLVEGQTFDYAPTIIFRGPKHIMVEWDPTQNPVSADRP
ncbi:MAG: Cytochrome [Solirubrobacterales bacterium]|nr:Cytochrome [Solirubrobacterales bacterium]